MGVSQRHVALLSIFTLGCSVTVLCITLINLTVTGGGSVQCLLTDTPIFLSWCVYAVAVASGSIFLTLCTALLQCLTCNCCNLGPVCNIGFAAVNALWWLIAAILFTGEAKDADAAGVPGQSWRTGVVAVSWIAFSFETIHAFLAAAVVGGRMCGRKGPPPPPPAAPPPHQAALYTPPPPAPAAAYYASAGPPPPPGGANPYYAAAPPPPAQQQYHQPPAGGAYANGAAYGAPAGGPYQPAAIGMQPVAHVQQQGPFTTTTYAPAPTVAPPQFYPPPPNP